jgi:hypothetical protein
MPHKVAANGPALGEEAEFVIHPLRPARKPNSDLLLNIALQPLFCQGHVSSIIGILDGL